MRKPESLYVTTGTTKPNAADQITTSSSNRLLWQAWAPGSPESLADVAFSSPSRRALPFCKHQYIKSFRTHSRFTAVNMGQKKKKAREILMLLFPRWRGRVLWVVYDTDRICRTEERRN